MAGAACPGATWRTRCGAWTRPRLYSVINILYAFATQCWLNPVFALCCRLPWRDMADAVRRLDPAALSSADAAHAVAACLPTCAEPAFRYLLFHSQQYVKLGRGFRMFAVAARGAKPLLRCSAVPHVSELRQRVRICEQTRNQHARLVSLGPFEEAGPSVQV